MTDAEIDAVVAFLGTLTDAPYAAARAARKRAGRAAAAALTMVAAR